MTIVTDASGIPGKVCCIMAACWGKGTVFIRVFMGMTAAAICVYLMIISCILLVMACSGIIRMAGLTDCVVGVSCGRIRICTRIGKIPGAHLKYSVIKCCG